MHHPPLLFFVFVNLLIFFFPPSSSSQRSRYDDCAPIKCGNINITYPFRKESQPEHCGLPGLQLSCDGEKRLDLELQRDSYYVNNINYDYHNFLIVNKQFLATACPEPKHNLAFESSPFSLVPPVRNISLYSNCSNPIQNSSFSQLSCLSKFGRYAYFTEIYEKRDEQIFENCGVPVLVPMLPSVFFNLRSKDLNFSAAVKLGFLIAWPADGCVECRSSGGRCGNNGTTSSPEFICFCTDREDPARCGPLPGNSKAVSKFVIGVSVSASIGILLLASIAGLIIFYIRRRNEKRNFLNRSIPYDDSTKPDYENGSTTQFLTSIPAVSLFTYKELEQATNSFNPSNELGDGGFGTVYYGKLRDGRSVAVKRLYESNYRRVEQFMNEVKILSGLRHQNLVCLYGCTSRHSRELLLVYEYIPNGTVADHLHGELPKAFLDWPTRLKIAVETAEALAFLHAVEPPIIHRDVKTNNILLDNSFRVKVADFGLSRLFPMDATHVSTAPQGTPGYVDPDYHKCYQLTGKSDVYSFGVVLVELISSKPAVDITRDRDEINLANLAIHKIINKSLDELIDPSLGFESDSKVRRMVTDVADLAFRCLAAEKEERPSMEAVLAVLKRIEKDGFEGKIPREQVDILADDVGLLTSLPPVSPDSVTDKWTSNPTTSDSSNEV